MPLEVEQLPLGAYQSNCYVVRVPDGAEAVVVDPGWPGESERIVEALAGASCAGILVTHGDLDHIAGVAELAEATGAPVHMPAAERETLERPSEGLLPGISATIRPHVPEVALRGDVLFAGSVGRHDRPGASWEALLASIRMLAERLPPETIVYPGHGPATTLERELATNPFLAELRATTP